MHSFGSKLVNSAMCPECLNLPNPVSQLLSSQGKIGNVFSFLFFPELIICEMMTISAFTLADISNRVRV